MDWRRLANSYHHLDLTPILNPVGLIGIGTSSGDVNNTVPLSSTGDRYPPCFFFSIDNGIATSIELSFNPPILTGKGSIRVGCDPNIEPQPHKKQNKNIDLI